MVDLFERNFSSFWDGFIYSIELRKGKFLASAMEGHRGDSIEIGCCYC